MPRNALRALSLAALIFIPSASAALKFLGPALTVFYGIGLFAVWAVLPAMERQDRHAQWLRRHDRWLGLAWAGAMALALGVLYPLAQARIFGVGSDRDDALMVGISALLDGRYPYYERTYAGGALSPMPGALLLGMPFHLLGHVVLQNLFWVLLGGWALACRLRHLATRWLVVGLLSLGHVGFMQDYVTGGDFALIAFYLGLAFWWVLLRIEDGASSWRQWLGPAVLLGLAVSSRPVWGLALVVVLAHGVRMRRVWPALAAAAAAGGVTLPFILYDPAHFAPLHVLGFVPASYAALRWVLPLSALVLALLPLSRPLSPPMLLGLLSASVAMVLAPSSLARLGHYAMAFNYLVPVGVLAAVALLVSSPAKPQSPA